MRGADLLTNALRDAGVTTIFSLSGNQIMPVYDACIEAGIRIVHTRHEAAAVSMADAWAQITGEIGVALVAGGPGFANSMSPLFSAGHAESPVVLLSGDSPMSEDGLGAFQELEQTAMTKPLVKAALRTQSAESIADDTARLVRIARAGRPGPVHMALPFDVLQARIENAGARPAVSATPPTPAHATDALPDVAALYTLLNAAQRPVILTGPHCNESRAGSTLNRVRAATGVPVVPMESPRGLKDPSLGTFELVLRDADLIVLIGKKIDFTLQFGKSPALPAAAKVAMVDPDPAVIAVAERQLGERLVYRTQADALPILKALAASSSGTPDKYSAWAENVGRAIANRKRAPYTNGTGHTLLPEDVCAHVQRVIDSAHEPILISDGGEFGQWAQALCHAPTRIINGVSGAIGWGLCYAIAAKMARPEATVIVMMGDGTAGFHLAEFDTAVREQVSFVAVVGNDGKWNAEHLIQLRSYGEGRAIGCALSVDARYEDVAQALGGVGASASTPDELAEGLRVALASGKPACINAQIEGLPAPVYLHEAAAASHEKTEMPI